MCVLLQWASRKVSTSPWAILAPRSRAVIRPFLSSCRTTWTIFSSLTYSSSWPLRCSKEKLSCIVCYYTQLILFDVPMTRALYCVQLCIVVTGKHTCDHSQQEVGCVQVKSCNGNKTHFMCCLITTRCISPTTLLFITITRHQQCCRKWPPLHTLHSF